jgi:hypothetical protein
MPHSESVFAQPGRAVFDTFTKVGADDFCGSQSLSLPMHTNLQFKAITLRTTPASRIWAEK